MKRQKRPREHRAYNRGLRSGLNRRSRDECPYEDSQIRASWMNGWREGRTQVAVFQGAP